MNYKYYLRILQVGSCLAVLSLLLFFSNIFFPFIGSKQLTFNIIVEILSAVSLVFLIKYPQFRPKFNLISYFLLAYLGAILVSTFFSSDFLISFFSNAERMFSFWQILHLVLFYFILQISFRSWQEWRWLFLSSLAVAFIMSVYSFYNLKPGSLLGNEAYFAAFLIFNLYFALIFIVKDYKPYKWVYLAFWAFFIPAFVAADITGAFIGLGASLFIGLILVAVFYKNKLLKLSSIILSVLIVAIIALSFSFPQASFVKNNKVLRQISWQKNTFQTRLLSWQAAWQGFSDNPVVGVGFGNFTPTFDKYFEAEFYNHAPNETRFDRVHNNLLEVLVTTGLLGIIPYLAIFVLIFIYWLKLFIYYKKNYPGFLRSSLSLVLLVILSAFGAYFIQNLSIFDTLSVFMAFMILLAYFNHIKANKEQFLPQEKNYKYKELEAEAKRKQVDWLLIPLLLIFLAIAYWFNVRPMQSFVMGISGYKQILAGQIVPGLETYKQGLKIKHPFQRDMYYAVTFLAAQDTQGLFNGLSQEEKINSLETLLNFNAELLEISPENNAYFLNRAYLYNKLASVYSEDNDNYQKYMRLALENVDKAILTSPNRVDTYWLKGQLLINLGEKEQGLENFLQAISLNPDYSKSYCQANQAYLVVDKKEEAWPFMDKCLEKGGVSYLNNSPILALAVNHYIEQENHEKTAQVYERYAKINPSQENWMNLAKLQATLSNWEKAEKYALKALELTPESDKESVELFLKIVRSKQVQ
ncbi:MAG: O-antigen ligase family protein [Candidatus Pacebacteria bacterium]|nr:O-antigen ligase family protein [Candidatus Paceibacterota bacterium]